MSVEDRGELNGTEIPNLACRLLVGFAMLDGNLDDFTGTLTVLVFQNDQFEEYVDILNETCPKCEKVFYDFDACAALYCRCGTYFCGFCFEILENMSSAHDHVKHCPVNPNQGELFINLESWEQIRLGVKKKERKYFYKNLAKNSTKSCKEDKRSCLIWIL